jgi:hypothetical protein
MLIYNGWPGSTGWKEVVKSKDGNFTARSVHHRRRGHRDRRALHPRDTAWPKTNQGAVGRNPERFAMQAL